MKNIKHHKIKMKNIKHQKDIKASTFLWQKNYFLTNDPPFWPKNPKLTPNSSLHQPPPEKKNLKIGSKFIPPPPTALKSTLNSPSPFKTRRLKRTKVQCFSENYLITSTYLLTSRSSLHKCSAFPKITLIRPNLNGAQTPQKCFVQNSLLSVCA